jgi:hypothetical protein
MKRFTFAALAALALLPSSGVGRASAQVYLPGQQPSPFQRPTFSPYLNMTRGGNPAVNYFGLVRPQIQTAKSLQQLQQQNALPQMGPAFSPLTDESAFSLPMTGHAATFFNFSRYFPGFTPASGGGQAGGSTLGGNTKRR